jgi:hypothetical protein
VTGIRGRRSNSLLDERTREDTESLRRKTEITLSGELDLEDAVDLSQERLLDEVMQSMNLYLVK